eukprot:m.18970 g.18970  ORF g.18970 m.18970 type:complete len:456 (-) comp7476_c0_seq1:313-1680(-)
MAAALEARRAIGLAFIGKYYGALNEDLEAFKQLFGPNALFSWTTEASTESLTKGDTAQEKIVSLKLENPAVEVKHIECLSHPNSEDIVLHVIGWLWSGDGNPRKFSQTLFLAFLDGKYCLANDSLVFLIDAIETADSYNDDNVAVTVPAVVPASTAAPAPAPAPAPVAAPVPVSVPVPAPAPVQVSAPTPVSAVAPAARVVPAAPQLSGTSTFPPFESPKHVLPAAAPAAPAAAAPSSVAAAVSAAATAAAATTGVPIAKTDRRQRNSSGSGAGSAGAKSAAPAATAAPVAVAAPAPAPAPVTPAVPTSWAGRVGNAPAASTTSAAPAKPRPAPAVGAVTAASSAPAAGAVPANGHVDARTRRPARPEQNFDSSVYLSDLPAGCAESDIAAAFKDFQGQFSVSIKRQETNVFAFVDFNNVEAKDQALRLGSVTIKGAPVRVQPRRVSNRAPSARK